MIDKGKSTEKTTPLYQKEFLCNLSVYIMTIFCIYLKCKSVLTLDLLATRPYSIAHGYY